jgi:hypothetical protein
VAGFVEVRILDGRLLSAVVVLSVLSVQSARNLIVCRLCRSAQSILQLCLSMLLSYAQHLCSILQHMRGSHESMRRMMVEERLAYLLGKMLTSCSRYCLLLVSLKSFTSVDCTFYSSLDISRVFCN